MRLIDAEKCPCKGCPIEYCHENCKKYYAWLDGCDYDVEAVVAELERRKGTYFDGERCEGTAIKINDAISIVRGKE